MRFDYQRVFRAKFVQGPRDIGMNSPKGSAALSKSPQEDSGEKSSLKNSTALQKVDPF
jgi:hypothetical protein